MIKHIILWKIDDKYSAREKTDIKNNIKKGLEELLGKIDDLKDIKVHTVCLPSSNADLMLDSTFNSEADLKSYAANPLHNKVADTFVRPYTSVRTCFDFEV